MPIYRVKCDKCQREEDIYRAFKDYNDTPECCDGPMHRVIVPVMVATDIQPYRSMATGEIINSRSQHRAHLKQHRLIEVGNEKVEAKPVPIKGLKETIVRVANEKLR